MATDTLHHLNAASRPEVSLDNATRMINLRSNRILGVAGLGDQLAAAKYLNSGDLTQGN